MRYASGLEDVNQDLTDLSEKKIKFLPVTTKACLCLSGTPFRALTAGEFIEEILAPKPEARLRISAYSIADAAHKGATNFSGLQGRAERETTNGNLPCKFMTSLLSAVTNSHPSLSARAT